MTRKKTVAVVVAHADDLEFTCGGTVARFAHELGYEVYQYILTDNAKGSYRLSPEEVVPVSEAEAQRAGEILGLRGVRFGGYEDGELNLENPNVLRGKVMAFLREVRADIVMSWDPSAPYEDHPDHRACAWATYDAASFCGNPRFHADCGHPPYPVTEAYWFAKHPWNAETIVDISTTIDTKIEALMAHVCQMDLTVDALVEEARVLGLPTEALEQLAQLPREATIGEAVRDHCRETGKAAGCAYGERFRYQLLGMLHLVLGDAGAVQRDFQ